MSNYLESVDPEVAHFIQKEQNRQELGLELIASENYCSKAVMEAQGSCLTNKYAEGYPKKRYYNGCEFVDEIETFAIERLKQIFNAKYANVQPHSGSQANMAVYLAMLNPGETFLGMDLAQGGHLTHGSPVNFSGKLFKALHYGLDAKTEMIDYNQLEEIAKRERPKMIIAGASAYPRIIDFEKFSTIAKSIGATAPHPEGAGAKICMQQTLDMAGIAKEEVGYINAHGTSTPLGDAAETGAIKKVFGDHAYKLAVSSTKSMTGHLLGAAGGLESIFCIKALETGMLPPTINLDKQDPACDLYYVPNKAEKRDIKYALNNSFGFGGTNSSTLFKKGE